MTDIDTARNAAADLAYEEFEFDEGSIPEATGGWENDGLGNFTRAIFVPDADDASLDTVKGQFNVSFEAGSSVPDQVWATVDGEDIGRKPKETARVPGM